MEGARYSRHPSTFREAVEAYRLLAERYDDMSAHSNLASVVFPQLERYEEALEHAQAVRRLGSADAFSSQALVVTYLNLNRFREAHEAALEMLKEAAGPRRSPPLPSASPCARWTGPRRPSPRSAGP